MELIRYLLLALLVSLGTFIGYVISFYTKDELKRGTGYVELAQKLLIVVLAVCLLYWGLYPFAVSVILIAIVVFYFLQSNLIYFTFGVLFFVVSFYQFATDCLAFLICLFFILAGLLMYKEEVKRVFYAWGSFLLTAIVLRIIWQLAA
ncbi:hypothetical protein DRJ48_05320 [Candidatus Woesearchaeota archaeon]|nr:hypothetical protein [Candidatus Woesearchaeota archaeon]RLE41559.1 MAG: hypothetical protein DRJ48_05320 [Candidatus Woesearchaeota archaeon]